MTNKGKSGDSISASGSATVFSVKSRSVLEKNNRQTVRTIVAVSAVLVLGLVLIVTVLATRRHSSALTARQKEMSDIVAFLVHPALLNQATSPQARARDWLIYDDTVWVNAPPHLAVTHTMVTQRYALAVFYFATSGPSTWISTGWLHGPECTSHWAGVTCNANGTVQGLQFEQHGLVGEIPSELVHLSHLENFIVKQEPGLSGSIPSSIGQLESLLQWTVSEAALTGTLPTTLFDAINLSFVNLESNRLSGTLSSKIGQLTALQTLVLTNNTFHGTIPFDNFTMANLVFLALGSNAFEGTVSDSIRSMKRLRYLYLSDNTNLTGIVPPALGDLVNLRSLHLDKTSLSGRLPGVALARLKQLEFFSMQGCRLSGSIPTELNTLTHLQMVNLASNALTGNIPRISSLVSLKSLNLAANHMNGTIATAFLDLRSVESLLLAHNEFTGSLPTRIGRSVFTSTSASPLRVLDVSHNQLMGTISNSVCDLIHLETIVVNDNNFNGPIPSCISAIGTF